MNKNLLLMILLMISALILAPVFAIAAQVEGTVEGYNCIIQGKVCPIDKEDTMIALEQVFVVLTDAGKYYFVPNIDRAILARHLREKVQITGEISKKFKSIKAAKLEVWKQNSWKKTWSAEEEAELRMWLELGLIMK